MKEHTFQERGLYYRTNTFVSGRTTLVFIHGLSGSSSAWLPYEEYFKSTYNILTFDLRGHGKSIKYKQYEEYSIDHFADDIALLLASLNIEQFVLVSHSFGTIVAFAYLKKYQENARAAVFLSPIVSAWNSGASKIISSLLHSTRLLDLLPLSKKSGNHINYTTYPDSGDWNIPRMFADIRNTTLRVYLFCVKQSFVVDFTSYLHKITIPLLVVHGKKDTISPLKNSELLHKEVKNSTLVLLNEADHIIMLNYPLHICKEMEHFLILHNLR